ACSGVKLETEDVGHLALTGEDHPARDRASRKRLRRGSGCQLLRWSSHAKAVRAERNFPNVGGLGALQRKDDCTTQPISRTRCRRRWWQSLRAELFAQAGGCRRAADQRHRVPVIFTLRGICG